MGRFDVAQRKSLRGKVFLYAGAGAGKTASALRFARGLVGPEGRIHVLDTENESALHYLGRFGGEWSHEPMRKDYNPERFVEAIAACYREGIDCLVIDSITHAWRGPGGVLDIVEKAAKRYGGNSFAGWKVGRPAHVRMIEAIQKVPMHVVVTCRAKMGYEVSTDKTTGRNRPEKVGMTPVQDADIEYEFDLAFLIDEQHTAITSKDRSGVFDRRTGTITEEDGEAFACYLDGRELPYGYERTGVGDSSATVVEVDTTNMGAIDTPTQAPEAITVAGVEVVTPECQWCGCPIGKTCYCCPGCGQNVLEGKHKIGCPAVAERDDTESPADAAGLTEGAAEMGIEPWASDMACDTLEELFAEIGVTDSDDVWRRLVKAEMAAGRRLITPENAEEACTRIRTKIEQMQATK